jgi:hypothetical protein
VKTPKREASSRRQSLMTSPERAQSKEWRPDAAPHLQPAQTRRFETPVRSINVGTGTVVVSYGNAAKEPAVVKAGSTYDGQDTADLSLYSPDGRP